MIYMIKWLKCDVQYIELRGMNRRIRTKLKRKSSIRPLTETDTTYITEISFCTVKLSTVRFHRYNIDFFLQIHDCMPTYSYLRHLESGSRFMYTKYEYFARHFSANKGNFCFIVGFGYFSSIFFFLYAFL